MGNVKTASTATVDGDTPVVAAQPGAGDAQSQLTAQALADALDLRRVGETGVVSVLMAFLVADFDSRHGVLPSRVRDGVW